MMTLDEEFTAAWYASALLWQVKSGEVDMELFYSGTSFSEGGGFGMWSSTFKPWPVFLTKKEFVSRVPYGSVLLYSSYPDETIDHLAVRSTDGTSLILVNKKKTPQTISLTLLGPGKFLRDGKEIKAIYLEGFEAVFLDIE